MPLYYSDLPVASAVGRDLAGRGLRAQAVVIAADEDNFMLFTGVEVTNPAEPARGVVHLADDPLVIWRCPLGPGGLAPAQAAAAILTAAAGGSASERAARDGGQLGVRRDLRDR
jgi:hypothetical protein